MEHKLSLMEHKLSLILNPKSALWFDIFYKK